MTGVSKERESRGTNFQDYLLSLMKGKGFSLNLLAERSGIDPGFLSRVSRGLVPLPAETACRIADVLRVSTTELLEETGLLGEFPHDLVGFDSEIREACRRLAEDELLTPTDKDALLRLKSAWKGSSIKKSEE